jgi:hypothetical protein
MSLKHNAIKVFMQLKQPVVQFPKKMNLLESLPDKASVIFQKRKI